MLCRSLLLLAVVPALAAQAPVGDLDYGRDVRPILSNTCFACHGPDANKRKANLRLDLEGGDAHTKSGKRAVVPGDLAASELIRRIEASDGDQMPPRSSGKKKLTAEQVATLRRWVAGGGARSAHWAFEPPQRPTTRDAASPATLDRLVEERRAELGVSASPRARRATLLRRATLDLTGLPPTPDEVAAFLDDASDDAYARQLDRLLQSPRYAEHMARLWLDLARYGDTHGYHLDNVRTMWPYRDFVVRAFAANMPFDRFTIEQLAGDLLPNPSREQLIATGFNRCNPTTAEGGLIDAEYLAKYASDRVATTANVWMGLTMQCAACHDHKFDPVTQRDFYRMFAFFDSIQEEASDQNAAFAPPDIEVPSAEQESRRDELRAQVAATAAKLTAPDPVLDASQLAYEEATRTRLLTLWTPLPATSALSRAGASMTIDAAEHTVQGSGVNPARDVHEIVLRSDLPSIAALRLEALLPPDTRKLGRSDNGNFVLTAVELEVAPADDPLRAQKIALLSVCADHAQPGFAPRAVLDGAPATGWAMVDALTAPHELVLAPATPFGFAAGTLLRLRLHYESQFARHTLARVRVSVTGDAALRPSIVSPWSSVGPFVVDTAAHAFAIEHGPEHDPDGTGLFAGGKLAWQPQPAWRDEQVHDLGKVGNSAIYLRRVFECGSERQAEFAFGSDDGLIVWMNGERVLANEVMRPAAPDQERVRVRLRAGRNVLLLKVVNGGDGHAFFFRVIGEDVTGVPLDVSHALAREPATRVPADAALLQQHYRRTFAASHRALEAEVARLQGDVRMVTAAIPHTMVMRERKQHRDTRLLVRGQYDQLGEAVTPGVPAMFGAPEMTSRLELARWLVSGKHPLVARVAVNRLWAQLFGVGLVRTQEDFGYQGEWPSHREVLDWLACEFVDSGWNVQHVLRLILLSSTYQQASGADADPWQHDPDNRWLARGPRVRLDAEVIRDQALFVSGLLNPRQGGPGVNPYQPSGLWEAVGYVSSNTANYRQDTGDALYRRSLYTFWKRTSPPASMALFDAPTREACVVRRSRTNTPTQALALLNDVQQVEAARKLAERVLLADHPDDAARARGMLRLVLGRRADVEEEVILVSQAHAMQAHYAGDHAAARALLAVGETKADDSVDPARLAAWTLVAQTILNLDETVTKR